MTYWLYLDDERNPPKGAPWVVARTSEEARKMVLTWGLPEHMSLDHDLGGEDTSIRFIDWLIEHYYDSDCPGYAVHSANPIGASNLVSKLKSWEKSKKLSSRCSSSDG